MSFFILALAVVATTAILCSVKSLGGWRLFIGAGLVGLAAREFGFVVVVLALTTIGVVSIWEGVKEGLRRG